MTTHNDHETPGGAALQRQGERGSSISDFSLPGEPIDWALCVGGALVAGVGLGRRSTSGLFFAGLGAGVAYYGAQRAGWLDADRMRAWSDEAATRIEPMEIEESVTIGRPAAELYSFWRDFANFGQFMRYIEKVEIIDEKGVKSRWTMQIPRLGSHVHWEAEIVELVPGEKIAWRSVPGSELVNEGEVRFIQHEHKPEAEVHARMRYAPPAGHIGAAVLSLFESASAKLVRGDLERFKQLMETGEVASNAGERGPQAS